MLRLDKQGPRHDVEIARHGVTVYAKFIIDKEGNIRYFLTGSMSNVNYIKLEMKKLIETAKKHYTE